MLGYKVKVETPGPEGDGHFEEVWAVGIADSRAAKDAVGEIVRPTATQQINVLAPLSDFDCDVYRLALGQVRRVELRYVPSTLDRPEASAPYA